jgi:alpha-beta hydrolase superfamily lysophospholipase
VGGYQFALREAISWTRKDRIEKSRWALAALDPGAACVNVGSFTASDGTDVPYRLWLAKRPKAMILLLHGCCDYSGAFDDIAPQLASRGYSCLAYDQRGFGATQSRGSWTSKDRIVKDARNAIQFFRSRTQSELPLFVIGESMGGSVAVHAAAKYADLNIRGLVLVAPGALASSLRHTLYGWIMRILRFVARKSEIVIERTDAKDLAAPAAIRLLGDPMVMQAISPDLLAGVITMGHEAVSAAAQVTIPTLTMIAGRDDLLRAACVKQLHQNLNGPKAWSSVKDAPHLLLHWRHGGIVLRYARRWMERHLREQ